MISLDNDFDRYDAVQNRKIKRFPICDKCKRPIFDEYKYRTDDGMLCEPCFDRYVDKNMRMINEVDEW